MRLIGYILLWLLVVGACRGDGKVVLDDEIETDTLLLSADFSEGQYVQVEDSSDLLEWQASKLLVMDSSGELLSVSPDSAGQQFYRAKHADKVSELLGGSVWYVDGDSHIAGDGMSRETAFVLLQDAFDVASDGDVVFSRGTFYESVVINGLNDFAWIGDSDSVRRTILRGDVIVDELFLDMNSSVNGAYFYAESKPRSVTWNYQRDDELGSVTGIDGVRPYYGHLVEADSLSDTREQEGAWVWLDGVVYLGPPVGETYSGVEVTMCLADRDAVEVINSQSFLISGLDIFLWMGYANNTGYCIQGISCKNGVLDDINCWDYGWHALGFSGVTSRDCEVRNCNAYSVAELGGAVQIPYVFYASETVENLGHRLSSSTFHVYPPLTVSGHAIYGEMKPKMLLVHGDSQVGNQVGGVVMADCLMKSWLDRLVLEDDGMIVGDSLQGTSVASLDDAVAYNWNIPTEYPLQVIDCVFDREMPVPGNNAAFWRCRFNGTGYPDTRNFTSQHEQLITYCISSEFIYPSYTFGAHQYIRQHKTYPGAFNVNFENCLFSIGGSSSKESALFGVFKPESVSIRVSNSIFQSGANALLVRSYTNTSNLFGLGSFEFDRNWYDFSGTRAYRTSDAVGYYSTWEAEVDMPAKGAVYQEADAFNSSEAGDFSYIIGSDLDTYSVPDTKSETKYLNGINKMPYSSHYGPYQ